MVIAFARGEILTSALLPVFPSGFVQFSLFDVKLISLLGRAATVWIKLFSFFFRFEIRSVVSMSEFNYLFFVLQTACACGCALNLISKNCLG